MTDAEILLASNPTTNGLHTTVLGEFADDPAADDVYVFALKSNHNVAVLDAALTTVNNASASLTQLMALGFFSGVTYGGRVGVPDTD